MTLAAMERGRDRAPRRAVVGAVTLSSSESAPASSASTPMLAPAPAPTPIADAALPGHAAEPHAGERDPPAPAPAGAAAVAPGTATASADDTAADAEKKRPAKRPLPPKKRAEGRLGSEGAAAAEVRP